MLATIIPAAVASIYFSGFVLSTSYRLVRLAEIKFEHDATRSKDVKNDCINLTRYHVRELRDAWMWPIGLLDLSALKWGRALGDLGKK